ATVSVSGSTATVSVTGVSLDATALQTLLDGLTYRNGSEDPTGGNRVVTITSLTDSGADGGADDAVNDGLTLTSTVTVVPVNDQPTLTATGTNPTYTENGTAVDLFSAITASTIEAGQSFIALSLTVTNVTDGAAEVLTIGGTDLALTNGNSVAVSGGTATVSLSGSTVTVSVAGVSLDAA